VPTSRGWLVVAAAAAMLVAGSIFGARPLEQLGVGLLVLVGMAVAVVRLGRHELVVTRRVSPQRARPGQPVHIALHLANRGSGAAPLLLIEDRLPRGLRGSARFAIRGIESGGEREASVTVEAARRGAYEVGPMEISIVDPFALAQLRSVALDKTSFLVYPRTELLALPRDTGDRRTLTMSSLRHPSGARGEDFYTLREYVEGDDLRKIHWPSTAKRSRYMIRQEETPWQTRATILLDDRAGVHDGIGEAASFERAVEASASLVDLYHRTGYGYRLVTALAPAMNSGKGSDQWTRCLDLLATIRASGAAADALAGRLLALEQEATAEAALVVVTGALRGRDAVAISACRRSFREVTVIAFPAHRFSGQSTKSRWEGERALMEAVRLLARAGVRTLALGPDDPVAPGWAGLGPGRAQEAGWGRRPELV
jgi:uncharacterized protein (DUF58 family)